MGLWQHLVEGYGQNAQALKTRFPLSATSINNNTNWIAVVCITDKGKFRNAYKIDKMKIDRRTGEYVVPVSTINLPVTETSASRTSSAATEPHPVFDQCGYMLPGDSRFKHYTQRLAGFATSPFATPAVKAIHAYITKGIIKDDLASLKPTPKTYVIFEVETPGNPETKVWEDPQFFEAWHNYYLSTREAEAKHNQNGTLLDYIIGTAKLGAIYHPKKINNRSANSKLITGNDNKNFTFRGRFETAIQAVNVGYESSQKAHQFLRYLIENHGLVCEEQVILSFTVGKTENLLPLPLSDSRTIYDMLSQEPSETESDIGIELDTKTGIDYAQKLRDAFIKGKYSKTLEQHAPTVVLALDAPSDGRMAVTFYRELSRSSYLERVANWHNDCKWHSSYFAKHEDVTTVIPFIGAPLADRIIEAVYGRPRSLTDKSYNKIKKSARELLLRCVFDGAPLPAYYITSAVNRASNPMAATRQGKFDRHGFLQTVSTACALLRKDFKQRNREEYKLSLEHERTDRDYLYGRLLGAADKLEEYALFKDGKERVVTAALRHMQAFAQHPYRCWQTVHQCLVPYMQKAKGSFAFGEIEKISNLFAAGDYELDLPLNGTYLIGYYHERAYIDRLVAEARSRKHTTSNTLKETTDE